MRKLAAVPLAVMLLLGGAACSDEDGDGAETDEEIGELDQKVDEGRDELDKEIDEGEKETD